jgi:DNA-binding NarL/FixJ family response regulator
MDSGAAGGVPCPSMDQSWHEAGSDNRTGFLLKTTPPDQLVVGIETVAAGESLLAPSLIRRLIEELVRRPLYERVPRTRRT